MSGYGYVYLCYHKVEAAFAIQLATDLRNTGINVWLDLLEIEANDDWYLSLQTAMQNCIAFLPVMSPDYVTSVYGQFELRFAEKMGRPIFPVLLRPVSAAVWPPQVGYRSYVDFDGWQDPSKYQEHLAHLIAELGASNLIKQNQPLDPTTQYLRALTAMIEIHKTFLEYVRLSYQAQTQAHQQDKLRPRPRIHSTWGVRGSFSLLTDSFRRLSRLENIYDALNQYSRFVLLGAAGTGKTTTLFRLLEDSIEKRHENEADHPLPLYLNLALWDDALSFRDFVLQQWRFDDDPFLLMRTGKVDAYLDNLGDLGKNCTSKVEQIRNWLHSSEAQPNQVVIACESIAYTNSLNLNLPLVGIELLDRATIRKFIVRQLGTEEGQNLLNRLFVRESDTSELNLRWAVRNPLLLRALLFTYSHSPNGELPSSVGQLLLRLVMLQWQREQILQNSDWIPFEDIHPALSKLAFTMINDDLGTHVDTPIAQSIVGDIRLLYALASANILKIEESRLSFLHPMLQRIFAALKVERDSLHSTLSRPTFDEHGRRIARKWDNVIVVMAGFTAQPSSYIRSIADVDPYLAINCILSGNHIDAGTRTHAIKRLLHYAGIEDPDGRLSASVLLEKLTGGETISVLMDMMRNGDWSLRVATAEIFRDISAPIMTRSMMDIFNQWSWDSDPEVLGKLKQIKAQAVPVLLKVLYTSQAWDKRRGAIWALGELRDKAAVPALEHAVGDVEPKVRKEAVIALKNIRDVNSIKRLVKALTDEDWSVRNPTMDALIAYGSTAVPYVSKLLRSKTPQVRKISAKILGKIGDSSGLSLLPKLIADPDIRVRAAVVIALGRIKDSKAVPALSIAINDMTRTHDGRTTISKLAIQALLAIGTEDARNVIQQFQLLQKRAKTVAQTADDNSNSSETAKEKLIKESRNRPRITDNESLSAISKKLANQDWEVRRDAVAQLPRFEGDKQSLTLVLKVLSDTDENVRHAGVDALRKYDANLVIHGLMQALYDEVPLVSETAAEVLAEKGQIALPGLIEALDSHDINVRALAIESLGKIEHPSAVKPLIPLLTDDTIPSRQDEPISHLVADALKSIGTPDALTALQSTEYGQTLIDDSALTIINEADVQAIQSGETNQVIIRLIDLLEKLNHEDWQVRQHAAKNLNLLAKELANKDENSTVLNHLISALDDSEPFVRFTAIEAIAWLGNPSATPALKRMLSDGNWTNKIAAIRALGEIGDASVAPVVAEMMSDKKSLVKEVAAEILGKLKNDTVLDALFGGLQVERGFLRRASIEALGEIGSPNAIPMLLPFLKQDNPQIKWAVIEALGKIGDASVVDELAVFLGDSYQLPLQSEHEDENAEMNMSDVVIQALQKIGTPEALSVLTQWKKHQPAKSGA